MAKTVAVIERMDTGYGVSFPDFPTAGNVGPTAEEALRRAEAALDAHIHGMVAAKVPFLTIRSVDEIMNDPDHAELVAEIGPVTYALVDVTLPAKAVRVNITIDERLIERIDRAAAAEGETRSGYLAAAARARLAG
ncbi:MAG: type II toxin-antitoxin system HicB family antitoxin [Bradyrhizobium sp.]|nr:type II toxin-antitoxin system HicB family antitoxin [Bradyrhizobium sp.]